MTDERRGIKLEAEALSVGYRGQALIRDIAFSIMPGEIMTLIGPNGGGKSTILKTLAGQLERIGGSIFLGERELSGLSSGERARKMAVLLTDRVRTEYMRCFDVAAAGRYPYTGRLGILSAKDEEKVKDALRAVHALDLADRDFQEISDGQKQRILLARAICQEPKVLILDEPTSYLDIRHKLELLGILREMAVRDGITIIMSLHEIDLAFKISDRLILVKGDQISRIGTPEELLREREMETLFDLAEGSFDPLLGSAELPGVAGEPKVFVISQGGSGIPVYRKLQRERIPFAAGILFRNDLDYRIAKQLAVEVVEAEPFEEIPDEAVMRGRELIRSAERVINCGITIGTTNRRIQLLIDDAREQGKQET
ncbi:MAG: ABC transporter ATP-binding protein [Lachnospiraceae bacterium]|nr:ABC transporter ATP-binding protein [Lachnospiraceae bacterium]